MTELDAALVRRKLTSIVRNLRDLKDIVGLSLDEYTRDRFRQKGAERMLQEVVEAAWFTSTTISMMRRCLRHSVWPNNTSVTMLPLSMIGSAAEAFDFPL